MKLLKRGFIFAMLFALTGVGATFAAGTNNDNIQNFFLGNAPATSGDLNQVLALLVGPQGPPGAAGVAGKDGFVGLNGQDGKDGIDGAPGVAGEPGAPGASVAVVALPVGDRNCPIGGSKLVDGTGAETFICNGRPGQPGANGGAGATGATGPAGPAGARGETGTAGTVSSSNSNRFGVGSLGIGACDEAVDVELKHLFTGGQFTMNQIVVSGIDDDCAPTASAAAIVLKVWLTVRSSGALYGSGSVVGANYAYAAGDVIRCEKDITTSAWTGLADARVMTIEGTHSCINTTGSRTVVPRLNSLSSRDLADYVGFEIG